MKRIGILTVMAMLLLAVEVSATTSNFLVDGDGTLDIDFSGSGNYVQTVTHLVGTVGTVSGVIDVNGNDFDGNSKLVSAGTKVTLNQEGNVQAWNGGKVYSQIDHLKILME